MMTPVESKALFQKCFKEIVVPVLKQDGFLGSGTTWRRVDGEVIQLLNLQGSRHGGECCVNLGIHLTFLPIVGTGEMVQPKTITEPECEFRNRLTQPRHADQWWTYGSCEQEAIDSCHSIAELYQTQGRSFFGRLSVCPDDFLRVAPDQLSDDALVRELYGCSRVRLALALGRVAMRFGELQMARTYAEFGLANLGRAVALQLPLEEILNGTTTP